MLGSWDKNAHGGKHMGCVSNLWFNAILFEFYAFSLCWLLTAILCRSELAQRIAINDIAENMMAFNTNYKDTGLFGVYAVAKVYNYVIYHQILIYNDIFFCCIINHDSPF